MTQYNILNVKFTTYKLKSGIKKVLNLSSNVIGGSNDKHNFPHKLLLDTKVSKLCQTFENGSSANRTLLKSELSNMVLLGKFIIPIGRLNWYAGIYRTNCRFYFK